MTGRARVTTQQLLTDSVVDHFYFLFPTLFLNPGVRSHAHSPSLARAHVQILHLRLNRKALPCFPRFLIFYLSEKSTASYVAFLIQPFLHFILEFSSEPPYH